MLQVAWVPFAYQPPAYSTRLSAKPAPISGGVWYRFDVDGESPIVSGLVRLRVRDDLPGRCTPLRIELRLTLWTPRGLEDHQLNPELTEISAKKAERLLKRGV